MSPLSYIHAVVTGRLARWNYLNSLSLQLVFHKTGSEQSPARETFESFAVAARLVMHQLLCPSLGRRRILRADVKEISNVDFRICYDYLMGVFAYMSGLKEPEFKDAFVGWLQHAALDPVGMTRMIASLEGKGKFDFLDLASELHANLVRILKLRDEADPLGLYRLGVALAGAEKGRMSYLEGKLARLPADEDS